MNDPVSRAPRAAGYRGYADGGSPFAAEPKTGDAYYGPGSSDAADLARMQAQTSGGAFGPREVAAPAAEYSGDRLQDEYADRLPLGRMVPRMATEIRHTDEGAQPYDVEGKRLDWVRRPGMLPVARDNGEIRFAMPALPDILGNVQGEPIGAGMAVARALRGAEEAGTVGAMGEKGARVAARPSDAKSEADFARRYILHKDLHPNPEERVDSIMSEGLRSGHAQSMPPLDPTFPPNAPAQGFFRMGAGGNFRELKEGSRFYVLPKSADAGTNGAVKPGSKPIDTITLTRDNQTPWEALLERDKTEKSFQPAITIDGRPVPLQEGETPRDAARRVLGIPDKFIDDIEAQGRIKAGQVSDKGRFIPEAEQGAPALKTEGGLSFPEAEAADRLRLVEQRRANMETKGKPMPGAPNNERTVIKAPEGSGLPDFATGKITFDDWKDRVGHMLTPDEVHQFAKWYDEVRGTFLKYTGGDEALTDKYMRGWLVAQQNVDVTGAMNNVLLQSEQLARGVPEAEMAAAGMPNPTYAARQVLKGEPIEYGIGQKIADFVDSAEGKDVRSWMGNKEAGGSPFVVDVHTGRDTGLVDQELKNHLTRLGYDPKAVDKLATDFGTSFPEAKYENRAQFGRDLTRHLNDINWMGRSDWKPREVQAIGWMAMTKLTANKADDVVTGLERVMRRVSFEAAPGEGSPWSARFGERFSALDQDRQAAVTNAVTQRAAEIAKEISGVDLRGVVHGTGGWENFQNPAAVGQMLSTRQGAEIAANTLGYLLQQTEVWSNSLKGMTKNPKAFAVDIVEDGSHNLATNEGLRDLWGKIMEADPSGLIKGYQPIRTADGQVGIRVLVDKGGAKTWESLNRSIEGPLTDMLRQQPFSVNIHGYEADLVKARNDWKASPDGQGYLARLAELGVKRSAAQFDHHRRELEDIFERSLSEAEGKRAGKAHGGSVFGSPAYRKFLTQRLGARGPPRERTQPEPSSTLHAQTKDLADGVRPVVLLPSSSRAADHPPMPKGMAKADIPGQGTAFYNPSKISERELLDAAQKGRLNEVLGMGPTSKAEALARAALGDKAMAVVLRDAAGTPKVEQATTQSLAARDADAVKRQGRDSDTVEVTSPERVIAERSSRSAAERALALAKGQYNG